MKRIQLMTRSWPCSLDKEGGWNLRWGQPSKHSSSATPTLRDVLLPWRSVDIPHDTLHHPLDALIHPFACES